MARLLQKNTQTLVKKKKSKELNRWSAILYSWIRGLNILKVSILSKSIYRFYSNKNFIEIDLNDSKVNMDPKKKA